VLSADGKPQRLPQAALPPLEAQERSAVKGVGAPTGTKSRLTTFPLSPGHRARPLTRRLWSYRLGQAIKIPAQKQLVSDPRTIYRVVSYGQSALGFFPHTVLEKCVRIAAGPPQGLGGYRDRAQELGYEEYEIGHKAQGHVYLSPAPLGWVRILGGSQCHFVA
jgi:hypothetical protein